MNKTLVAFVLALIVFPILTSCGGNESEAPVAPDAPDASAISPSELADRLLGTWEVTYEDEALGYIHGSAFLDPVIGTAELTLNAPGDAVPVQLKARSVTIENSKVLIKLPPGSPSANVAFEPAGAVQRVGKVVRLGLGDGVLDVNLDEPESATGEVTITLVYDDANDTLTGQWVQPVDAQNGRAAGAGRHGSFRYGEAERGGAEMVGREIWYRPPIEIKSTFALGNQFGSTLTGPSWPYPYVVGTSEPTPRGVAERYLMIVGRNLPRNIREEIEIESEDSNLRYRVYQTEDELQELPDSDETTWYAQGKSYLQMLENNEQLAFERKPDDTYMILHVRLEPGIQPGRKTLRLNGVEAEWRLLFGDHRADIGFVRDVNRGYRWQSIAVSETPPQMELADFVFQTEQIFFEVRAHTRLPFESLQFFINKKGKPLLFAGKRELVATRLEDESNTYHSPPIYLIAPGTRDSYPGDAIAIEVTNSDRLQVVINNNVLLANPLDLDVPVLESPKELRRAITFKSAAPDSLRWTDAVLQSARCGIENLLIDSFRDAAIEVVINPIGAGIDVAEGDVTERVDRIMRLARDIATDRTSELTREEAELFVDLAPFNLAWQALGAGVDVRLETSVKIGEHAGMLVMRQVLVDLLRSTLPMYTDPKSDVEITGLRDRLEPYIKYDPNLLQIDIGNIGINKVPVAAPDGHVWTLEMSYLDGLLMAKDEYGLEDNDAVNRYQVAAMREARENFADSIRTTISRSESIGDCDIDELSKLTGFGMREVSKRAKSALMRQIMGANGVETWVADWSAQAHVDHVAHIAETLAIQQDESNESWKSLFDAVSLASVPLGAAAAGTRFAYAFLVINRVRKATDMFYSIGMSGIKQWQEKKELAYALGASVIIGTSRYDAAKSNDTTALWIAYSLVNKFLWAGGKEVYKSWAKAGASRTVASVDRGKKLIGDIGEKFVEKSAFGLLKETLSLADHHDMASAVHHALGLEATIGRDAMNEDELAVLGFIDLLVQSNESQEVPEWAAGLDRTVMSLLGDMIYRNDIRLLIEKHPGEVSEIVKDEVGFRVLHRPQTTLVRLESMVDAVKSRPPARGHRFVEQAAEPEFWNVERKLNEGGFFFDRKGDGNHVTLNVYEGLDREHRVMRVERKRVADRVFGSGKDLLRLERWMQTQSLNADGDEHVERNIEAMQIPYLENADGVPVGLVAELRAFQVLGFEFADNRLGGVVLPNVRDARLIGEMHWMRQQEPDRTLGELFGLTTAMDEVEGLATQMGFSVGEVRIVDGAGAAVDPWLTSEYPSAPLSHLASEQWLRSDGSTDWSEFRDEFLEIHNVQSGEEGRADSRVPYGYDVYVRLEALH